MDAHDESDALRLRVLALEELLRTLLFHMPSDMVAEVDASLQRDAFLDRYGPEADQIRLHAEALSPRPSRGAAP